MGKDDLSGVIMQRKFRTGDVVRLQCGGPETVVVNILIPQAPGSRGLVSISWIDQRGQLKMASLPEEALILIRKIVIGVPDKS